MAKNVHNLQQKRLPYGNYGVTLCKTTQQAFSEQQDLHRLAAIWPKQPGLAMHHIGAAV